jgi:hypothetical protein
MMAYGPLNQFSVHGFGIEIRNPAWCRRGITAPIHEFPTLGTRPVCTGPEAERAVVRSGGELELDPTQPLAIITAASRNAPAERAIATSNTTIAADVPGPRFGAGREEVGVPDRHDYIREFQRAAADFVSAQIAFTNAVVAARKAGISDQELVAISGLREADISQFPGGRTDPAAYENGPGQPDGV